LRKKYFLFGKFIVFGINGKFEIIDSLIPEFNISEGFKMKDKLLDSSDLHSLNFLCFIIKSENIKST
jgi:hypothetical protein